MKLLMTALCIVFFTILPAKPQNAALGLKNFEALYKATYEMSFQPDSNDAQRRVTGILWTLFANNEYSFIVNNEWYKRDSMVTATAAKGEAFALASIGTLMVTAPQPRATHRIFIDRPNRRITTINTIHVNHYAYNDPLDIISWQIEPETRLIGNLQTQKARGSFAGRDYIAWFTRQIPLPLGPHKFNGLPGLIVEIEDTRQHYRWELIDFKPARQLVRVVPESVEATTWHDFRTKQRKFRSDPVPFYEAMGFVFPEEARRMMRENARLRRERSNNRIELRRD
jgi:GLPGLI family protein